MSHSSSAFCWYHDNGINLDMILDSARNNFYYEILKDTVYGKECIDVGFGTGILTLIAIHLGAKKIIAFETNAERYFLGKNLIKKLSLEGKVELKNERFQSGQSEVIIQEIIGHNLWNEGLRYILDNDQLIVPGNFHCEFYFCDTTNVGKFQQHFHTLQNINFNLNSSFKDFEDYLNLLKNNTQKEIEHLCEIKISVDEYNNFLESGYRIGKYEIRTNDKNIFVNGDKLSYLIKNIVGYIDVPLKINNNSKTGIILPKFSISHNNKTLTISPCDNNKKSHWAVPSPISILHNHGKEYVARTYLDDGLIRLYAVT